LPPGWREQYGSFDDPREKNANRDETTHPWFSHEEMGEKTWHDPRLTSLALKERGLDIKEITLI
jgi:hypothetical protein